MLFLKQKSSNYFFLSLFARANISETDLKSINSELEKKRDWVEFLCLAQDHNMVPLVNHHVLENSINFPSRQILVLKAMMIEHKALHQARCAAIKEIDHHLSLNGLSYIGLKGIVIAPMLYTDNELRPMRDIDILLSEEDCLIAADLLRELGFQMPHSYGKRWKQGNHHLPDGFKKYTGFDIYIELHHDAIHRDANGSLKFTTLESEEIRNVKFNDLKLKALGHVDMLNHLCLHIQAPDGERLMKLINMLDIVLYAEKHVTDIPWGEISNEQPHITNTLRCINMIIPLSTELKSVIGDVDDTVLLKDVGVPMGTFTYAFSRNNWSLLQKIKSLLSPSEWWMHMYYNVLPQDSLTMVRYIVHPFTLIRIVLERFASFVFGR